jgi:hypothetical protein
MAFNIRVLNDCIEFPQDCASLQPHILLDGRRLECRGRRSSRCTRGPSGDISSAHVDRDPASVAFNLTLRLYDRRSKTGAFRVGPALHRPFSFGARDHCRLSLAAWESCLSGIYSGGSLGKGVRRRWYSGIWCDGVVRRLKRRGRRTTAACIGLFLCTFMVCK